MPRKTARKTKNVPAKQTRFEFIGFLKQPAQKKELLIFSLIYLALFILFRYAYPWPDTFPDTGNYVLCARTMEVGGYRPIGYSWFLNWFHAISSSVHFVFLAQYIINALATLYMLFTLKYFIPPVRSWLFPAFALPVILCPTTLYLANVIMSDSVFISLSLLWTASGIWLINKKRIDVLILHLAVLYLLIQVRYSGLFFPLFSALILLLRWGWSGKLLWLAPLLVFGYIVSDTRKDTEKALGTEAFSAFSGWQLANNAIHVVPHIDLEPRDIRNRNNQFIHSYVIQQDSSVYPEKGLTTAFMWEDTLALKRIFRSIQISRQMGYVKAWVLAGTIFQKYGRYLILKYPLKFIRHFVIYNLRLVFYPNPELFSGYQELKPDEVLTGWFGLGEVVFTPRWNFFGRYVAPVLPAGNLLTWSGFIIFLLWCLAKRKSITLSQSGRDVFVFLLAYVIIYLSFHLVTTPIVLRYLTALCCAKLALAYLLLNGILDRKDQALTRES